ncbi:MAG TPA: oligosaccharide flippase family protein, partial [Candidatus Bathyarchaeia archaeon]|nr:oligosaccharide flippase family protein [Candidatus Bathyarchaeia archaeon]
MSDHKKAISGVFWLGTNRAISFSAAFISTVVLARLLDPNDFGIVALATAVALIFNRLSAIGLSPEVMRLKDNDPDRREILSTYFWVNLGLVLLIFLAGLGMIWASSFLKQRAFLIFVAVFAGWSFNNIFGMG